MTREEAIERFNGIINAMSISIAQSKFYPSKAELNELCDIAIEALKNTPTENTNTPTDLISRSGAIKDISYWATNIIDPKMLVKEDALYILETLPSVDAVEVVRCKCCRWWNGNSETMHNDHLCRNWSKFGSIGTSADDFCSYGERIGDNDVCIRNR